MTQKNILDGLAFVSALLILNGVYYADIMWPANTFVLGVFVLEWLSLVHCFFVLLPMAVLEKIHYTEIWKQVGKYSWYIFLLQMMCFGLL